MKCPVGCHTIDRPNQSRPSRDTGAETAVPVRDGRARFDRGRGGALVRTPNAGDVEYLYTVLLQFLGVLRRPPSADTTLFFFQNTIITGPSCGVRDSARSRGTRRRETRRRRGPCWNSDFLIWKADLARRGFATYIYLESSNERAFRGFLSNTRSRPTRRDWKLETTSSWV